MTDEEKLRLDTDGYLVLENLMDASLLDTVRKRVEELFEHEGAQAGAEFKLEPHARRRKGGGDERAHVAWRHGQSHRGRAARHARLLHPLGQAAAAVPEAAAASGNAEPVESFGAEDSGARRSAQRRAELAALRGE